MKDKKEPVLVLTDACDIACIIDSGEIFRENNQFAVCLSSETMEDWFGSNGGHIVLLRETEKGSLSICSVTTKRADSKVLTDIAGEVFSKLLTMRDETAA